MKETPLVSIVMPVYNSADFVGSAIESVLAQTYSHWELIIINDASTDVSAEVIEKYKGDSRITLVNHTENKGVCFSRNEAIDSARGTFIACLDSDDEWHADKLAMQVDALEDGATISFSAIDIITTKGEVVGKKTWESTVYDYHELLKYNFVAHSSLIFSRTILGNTRYVDVIPTGFLAFVAKKVSIKKLVHEDYAFLLNLFRNKNIQARYISQSLVRYRVHKGNYSRGIIKKILSLFVIYKKNEGFSTIKSLYCTIRRVFFYLF